MEAQTVPLLIYVNPVSAIQTPVFQYSLCVPALEQSPSKKIPCVFTFPGVGSVRVTRPTDSLSHSTLYLWPPTQQVCLLKASLSFPDLHLCVQIIIPIFLSQSTACCVFTVPGFSILPPLFPLFPVKNPPPSHQQLCPQFLWPVDV